MPQVPDRSCPSQATVADMVIAKYMYIYVNTYISTHTAAIPTFYTPSTR